MHRENHLYLAKAEEISGTDPHLAAEIQQRGIYQHAVNDSIRCSLQQVISLPGFSGDLWFPPAPEDALRRMQLGEEEESDEDAIDETVNHVDEVMHAISRLN
ncbi:hypothetical protein FRC02_002020 [Tulasnella sp. 418]|nr:hypothetical protein FRC02_002020 [Tulasnella sp. 418]